MRDSPTPRRRHRSLHNHEDELNGIERTEIYDDPVEDIFEKAPNEESNPLDELHRRPNLKSIDIYGAYVDNNEYDKKEDILKEENNDSKEEMDSPREKVYKDFFRTGWSQEIPSRYVEPKLNNLLGGKLRNTTPMREIINMVKWIEDKILYMTELDFWKLLSLITITCCFMYWAWSPSNQLSTSINREGDNFTMLNDTFKRAKDNHENLVKLFGLFENTRRETERHEKEIDNIRQSLGEISNAVENFNMENNPIKQQIHEFEKKWISELKKIAHELTNSNVSIKNMFNDLKEHNTKLTKLESECKKFVELELIVTKLQSTVHCDREYIAKLSDRLNATIQIAPENFASETNGAYIVSYANEMNGVLNHIMSWSIWLRQKFFWISRYMSVHQILNDSLTPGSCWKIVGDKATVTIKLSSIIYPTVVELFMPGQEFYNGKNIKRHVNEFEISASLYPDRDFTSLGVFKTDLDAPRKKFYLSKSDKSNYIRVKILSNHGDKHATVMYKIAVYGRPG